MDGTSFWLAMGLVLVVEGFMPFVSPAMWRKTFQHILQLSDGQLRFFGLLSLAAGVALICLLV